MAAREESTLSDERSASFEVHLASCERCRRASELGSEDDWRWLTRAPADRLDRLDSVDAPVIPVVEPAVFVVERELASGGMGRVLRARDRRLGRTVAIKEVLSKDLQPRFEREALITARLQHPAIVPIYEAGTWPDGSGFYTMRLVPGDTLHAALARATDLASRLALLHHVVAITEAVAYAHGLGVIHRDLKPNNVLVGDLGESVVIDWGLAKELDAPDDDEPVPPTLPMKDGEEPAPETSRSHTLALPLTRAGAVMGTPGFMAPEQARGEPPDERADVFALGAILYTLLSGVRPYARELAEGGTDAVVAATATRAPIPIDQLAPDAPADLRAIVTKAMTHDRESRYRTAREMAEELRRFETGQLLARPYGARELALRWLRRHRTAVIVGAAAFAAIVIVTATAAVGVMRSRATEREALHTAERARAESEANLAALLEEQGRTAVQDGRLDQALVYLSEALSRGRETVSLQHLLGVTLRDRDLAVGSSATFTSPLDALALTTDDTLVALTADGEVSRWAGGQRVSMHTIEQGVGAAWPSPDGAIILTCRTSPHLEAWDTKTGARRWASARKTCESGPIIAFSPSGDEVVVADDELGAPPLVLDSQTGTPRATLPFAGAPTTAVAYSSDGARIATADARGTVRVWNTASRSVQATWAGAAYKQLAFVDAATLVGATAYQLVTWSVRETGRALANVRHDARISHVVTSARGRLVATADDRGSIRIFEASGELVGASHETRHVNQLAFTPDGDALASSGTTVQIWRARPMQLLRTLETPDDGNWPLTWSHDGSTVAVRVGDGSVRRWRKPRGNLAQSTRAVDVDASGERWVALTDHGLQVRRFGDEAAPPPTPLDPVRRRSEHVLELSADGTRALVLLAGLDDNDNDRYALLELPSGKLLATIATTGSARLSPNGARVVAHEILPNDHVRVLDGTSGAALAVHPLRALATDALSTHDGRRVIVLEGDEPLSLPGLSTESPVVGLGLPKVMDAVLDPAGRWILAWQESSEVSVLDLRTGAGVARWTAPTVPRNVASNATGNRVAVQSQEGVVEVRDLPRGELRFTATGTTPGGIALDPVGARLFTGQPDGTVRIWDAARGVLLETLRGHLRPVHVVKLDASGSHLLAAATDGTVTTWQVGLERRTAAEIAKIAGEMPWRLEGGSLVQRK